MSTATSASASPKPRVAFWDNARFVAVTLVVVDHAIQRLTSSSDHALTVYLFIYAFHVPAFAVISGYFSRSGPLSNEQIKKILTHIVLPYVIMEIIWTVIQWLVEGKVGFNPSIARWTLWFLLALGIFRLVLPYLALVKWPLFWAVVLSIGVGYLHNVDTTFSLSRAFGILPFFLLGWQLRRWGIMDRWMAATRAVWWVRAAAAAVMAAWMGVVLALIGTWRAFDLQHWFFYDRSYHALGNNDWTGGLIRLGLILLAVLLVGAFFVLMPRSHSWLSGFGEATMYIYLLHTFVLYPIRQSGILHGQESDVWLIGMIAFAIVVSIALASGPVRKVFRPLVEPRAEWLFQRLPEAEPPAPSSPAPKSD
ncbi:MAG: fucose 4-O-acetylase [Salinibacterium sp.]|nr:MAG: fucose 4-O-acetylase [Salinibacterium sp.]